jgi:hypothetical protein
MRKCAECGCVPSICKNTSLEKCTFCTMRICCCEGIHEPFNNREHSVLLFFNHVRTLFAAALGIEILCISAAIIGENSAFYFFGYNLDGIILGYIIGYTAAGFATFMAILGRYDFRNVKIESCCSVLEHQCSKSFFSNFVNTIRNFGLGFSKLRHLHNQPDLKRIMKTSLVILFTAESVCILTAETIDLIFYKDSILLSIPLALLAGSFTVVVQGAYKKMKSNSKGSL